MFLQVLFLPNRPGAFVAEVLVFSQSFLRNENATADGIPVSVTFQAIAEKPKIVVRFYNSKCSKFWNTSCLLKRKIAQIQIRLSHWALTDCYSTKHFVSSSLKTDILFENRKRKV